MLESATRMMLIAASSAVMPKASPTFSRTARRTLSRSTSLSKFLADSRR